MTSTEINQEIATLEERQASLNIQLDHARSSHETAQERLTASATDETMHNARVALAGLNSLSEAAARLEAQITEKRTQLEEAKHAEALSAAELRIPECESEIEEAERQFHEGRARAHAALVEILRPTFEASQRRSALKEELRRLLVFTGSSEAVRDRLSTERLEPFGEQVDAALQLLWIADRQGTREERRERFKERSKRIEAGAQKRLRERDEQQRRADRETERFDLFSPANEVKPATANARG